MIEVWKQIQDGYESFVSSGNYMALYFVCMLYVILTEKIKSLKYMQFVFFTTMLFLFPITRYLLLLYRTNFYSYESLLALLPMNILIAYVFVQVMTKYEWQIKVGVVILIILCGSLSLPKSLVTEAKLTEDGIEVLECFQEYDGKDKGSVWGPNEILGEMRKINASIEVVYGRDLWDEQLQAYTYDKYSQDKKALYTWMNQNWIEIIAYQEEVELTSDKAFQLAKELGISMIILKNTQIEVDEVKNGLEELDVLGYMKVFTNESYHIYALE